jgi:hypothetical protein
MRRGGPVEVDGVGIRCAEITCSRRKNEILMIALTYTHAAMFEVCRFFVFRYAHPFLRRIGRYGYVSPPFISAVSP